MRVLVRVSDNLINVATRALLAAERDLTVIDGLAPSAFADGPGAAAPPDVVVCIGHDVSAQGRPADATARPPIVALLPLLNYELAGRALRSGAAGLHCVSCHLPDLPAAVRAVGSGAPAWFAPCVTASIAAHLSGRDTHVNDHGLTAREALILRLMANGATNAEVAGSLRLEIRTVKHHTSSIFRKLGARNRAEAVALAYRLGLVA